MLDNFTLFDIPHFLQVLSFNTHLTINKFGVMFIFSKKIVIELALTLLIESPRKPVQCNK